MSEYSNASLLLLPNAWKIDKMFCAKPTDGSADIPYVRPSVARRMNSAGVYEQKAVNEPLLEFPVSGCPSYNYEIGRYNYCLYSSDFSNAVWQVGGASSKALSAAASIIEGKSAYDITGLTTYGSDFFYQNLIQVANSTYYVIVKAVNIGDVGKTITLMTGNGTGRQIILTADFVKYELYSATSETYFYLTKGNSGTPATQFTICHAQVEVGLYGTSPIVTTNVAAQRGLGSSTLTGLISKGLLDSAGGTFFIQLKDVKYDLGSIGIYIGNIAGTAIELGGSINNRIYIWKRVGGVQTSVGVTPTASTLKLCFTVTATTILIYCNGALIYTVSGSFVPSDFTQLYLEGSSFSFLLEKLEMQPIVVTGVEAIQMTT